MRVAVCERERLSERAEEGNFRAGRNLLGCAAGLGGVCAGNWEKGDIRDRFLWRKARLSFTHHHLVSITSSFAFDSVSRIQPIAISSTAGGGTELTLRPFYFASGVRSVTFDRCNSPPRKL